jgi:predicted DNA-binding transcriptional regulator YafY
MPDQKAIATQQRRNLILEAIQRLSRTGRSVPQAEIVNDLRGKGYAIDKHHVRRDLKALLEFHTQLECNDNPRDGLPRKGLAYGYRWRGKDAPPETGLTIPEALSLVLVERYLSEALPASLTGALNNMFEKARSTLDLQKKNPKARWAEKICVVQPTQPLLPPKIDDAVVNVVHEALLNEEQIEVDYRNWAGKQEKLVLHPLGLMQRGPASYLIALCFDYDDPRPYPLHRIISATRLYADARKKEGFTINDYADEQGHFGTGKMITFKARVRGHLLRVLEETKLEAKQTLSKPDAEGWCQLMARVRDTWQLRWWLLAQEKSIEVIGPPGLRASKTELKSDEQAG